nr:MAG TPA: hypothetical protein [Caudoviricetes sp.]
MHIGVQLYHSAGLYMGGHFFDDEHCLFAACHVPLEKGDAR